jgi:hypothetical protein
MDKQGGKWRKETDKEERNEMIKTDMKRYASSYKPAVFNFGIEESPKVESGDVSETSVPFCQTKLRHLFIFIVKRA